MKTRRERHSDRRAQRRARGPGPALAGLAAAGLLLSACASMGPAAAGSEGETPGDQAAQAPPADAKRPTADRRAQGPAPRPGAGLMSPLATISYIPLKLLPCSVGAAGAAVGFLFTFDAGMLRNTVTLNCGGDWIITPGMLEGKEGFRPVGRVEAVPPPPPPPVPRPSSIAPPIGEPGFD